MEAVTYALYPVFRVRSRGAAAGGLSPLEAAHEVEVLVKEWSDRVSVRGVYSASGFRADADLLMWWLAPSPDDLQGLLLELLHTPLGRELELTWSFMGAVRASEFNTQHLPAFARGEAARKYLCVYPFVRTSEWYLLPSEERRELLREHGEMGREFPDVLANTTSAFGLGDWEWILAFEADELHRIVDCIRRLRDAKARRFTKEEIPFVTGIRRELAEAVRGLV